MYDPGVRSMQLDLTTECNAACPMCSRTGNKNIESRPDEITLEKFKKYFPVEFIQQLEVVKFCGNYGDPAFAKDCLEIHQYLDEVNPNIMMTLHTNGSLRNRKFWQQLGEVYARNPYRLITFHIDGLKDTNPMYRVNTDFDTIIKNAKAAIGAGANCLWAFIPFAHNEHQIEEAEELSKQYGFIGFAVKVSARFNSGWKPVKFIDRKLGIERRVYPPTSPEFDMSGLAPKTDKPVCSAQTRRDIFVDMRGNVLPCCWYASSHEDRPDDRQTLNQWGSLNLNDRPLVDILSSDLYNGAIQRSWDEPPTSLSRTCYSKCRGETMDYWKTEQGVFSTEEAKWAQMRSPTWTKVLVKKGIS